MSASKSGLGGFRCRRKGRRARGTALVAVRGVFLVAVGGVGVGCEPDWRVFSLPVDLDASHISSLLDAGRASTPEAGVADGGQSDAGEVDSGTTDAVRLDAANSERDASD